MTDYSDRIEKWTTYLSNTDPVVYFSGRRIVAGGKEYAIVKTKSGHILRGVDGAKVETFGNRSQPAKALEEAFMVDLENGNIDAEIMEYEMSKR